MLDKDAGNEEHQREEGRQVREASRPLLVPVEMIIVKNTNVSAVVFIISKNLHES